MKLIDIALPAALATLVVVHLAVAPYTKVEESFGIQAAHDVLVYGTPTGAGAAARLAARYDHIAFPGAVPRTFVGAVVLAGVAQPLIQLLGLDGPAAQLVVRGILGLANAAAMLALARALAASCGRRAARWYLALQAAQFHVLFYASRTLPNMFAFFLTTLAFAFLVGGAPGPRPAGRIRVALCLLAVAAVVFRAEVALLLAAVAAYLVAAPLASAERIVRCVALAAAVALLLSVPVDSYFWQARGPFWPELHGFLFNVVGGHASAWGTAPWHYYVSSALPRLLLNPAAPALVPLALARPATRGPARLLAVPALVFVAVYSLQPHKEARFVLYAVPPLTAAAALGAAQLQTLAAKRGAARAGVLAVAALTAASFAAACGMLLVSALNYPGGEALAALRARVAADPGAASVVVAHADVLACMTGVTLFGSTLGAALPSHAVAVERRAAAAAAVAGAGGDAGISSSERASSSPSSPHLVVDKTEDARLQLAEFWTQFDYLLMEDPGQAVGGAWTTVAVVEGYAGVEVLRPGQAEQDGEGEGAKVVGHGRTVRRVRAAVRARTGGWWVGPRMAPRIHLLERVKGGGGGGGGSSSGSKSGNKVVVAQRVSS